MLDLAGDRALDEHFNDAAAVIIPNNTHNPGPRQGDNQEEDIEDPDDKLDLNKDWHFKETTQALA